MTVKVINIKRILIFQQKTTIGHHNLLCISLEMLNQIRFPRKAVIIGYPLALSSVEDLGCTDLSLAVKSEGQGGARM